MSHGYRRYIAIKILVSFSIDFIFDFSNIASLRSLFHSYFAAAPISYICCILAFLKSYRFDSLSKISVSNSHNHKIIIFEIIFQIGQAFRCRNRGDTLLYMSIKISAIDATARSPDSDMSVEFRNTSNDDCNSYGKIKEEETASTVLGTSSSNSKTRFTTGRCNTILIGALIFVNVVIVALVIMEIATTAPDGEGLSSSDSATIQRLLEITKRNSNKTSEVKATLDNDVIDIMTSLRSIMGWKKSGDLFYRIMTDKETYKAAAAKCKSIGGRLATKILRDPTIVRQMIAGGLITSVDTNTQYWIGLNDLKREGEWEWVDGEESNNATVTWWPGEPNDNGGNEDCGHIRGELRGLVLLNDSPCSNKQPYICEIDIPNLV